MTSPIGAESPITEWINFNMSTGVVNHKTSGISGITDNGTGDFTINPTTSFPAVYGVQYGGAAAATASRATGSIGLKLNDLTFKTTALLRVQANQGATAASNGNTYDAVDVTISILGV